jgi:hypothetical protein
VLLLIEATTLHPSGASVPKRRRTIQILIELGFFLALVGATALLLRPLQTVVLSRMADFKGELVSRAESVLDRRILYGSLGPSVFRSIDLRQVSVVGADGTAVLSVGRLRIEYSILDLISGKGAASFRGLLLERPTVLLDIARDADLLRLLGFGPESERGTSGGSLLPPNFPDAHVRVRDGTFSLSGDGALAEVRNGDLSIETKDGRLSLSGTAKVLLADPSRLAVLGETTAVLSLRGDAQLESKRANFTVQASEMETSLFSLSRQTARVSLDSGVWEVRKIRDRSPFDFIARWNSATGEFGADLEMERFEPIRLVVPKAIPGTLAPFFYSAVTGTAKLEIAPSGSVAYAFDLRGRTPPRGPIASADIVAAGSGTERTVRFGALAVSSPLGSFSFSGSLGLSPFLPEGTLSIDSLRLPDGRRLSSTLTLETTVSRGAQGPSTSLFSESVQFGDLRLDAVDGILRADSEALTLTASAFKFADSSDLEEVDLGRVELEGAYVFSDAVLQATISLESFPAADVVSAIDPFIVSDVDLAPVKSLTRQLSVTTEVFLSTDFTDFSFNAPRVVAASRGTWDGFAVASASGTKNGVSVRDVQLFWSGDSASGEFSADFTNPRDVALSARILYRDTAYNAEGMLLDGNNLSVTGDYGLLANLIFADGGGLSGTVSFDSLPVPVGQLRFSASADAQFRFDSVSSWSAASDSLRVERTGPGAELRPILVQAKAKADQNGASIPELSVVDAFGQLSGDGSVRWSGGTGPRNLGLRLADQFKAERYELEAELGEGGIAFRAYAASGRASRFFADEYAIGATGEVRGQWRSRADFEAFFVVSDLQATIEDSPLRLSGSGRITADSFEAESARVDYRGGTLRIESLSADRPGRSASARASFRGAVAGRELSSAFTAVARLSEFPDWLQLPRAIEAATVDLRNETTRYGSLSVDPFDLRVVKDGYALAVSGGPSDSVRFRYAEDGVFYAALSAPSPLRGTISGTVRDGRIEASANGVYLDFAALWSMISVPEVEFTGGVVTGSLTVSGPLADPDFFGSATALGFLVRIPNWVAEEVGPASASVAFTGKEFAFGPVSVSAGMGRGTVSGKFRFDRWIPETFELVIDVPRETPIPAKANVSGIIADGRASGHFVLANSADLFSVSGKIGVESSTIILDMNAMNAQMAAAGPSTLPASARNARPAAAAPPPIPFVPVKVDVELVSGKKVEFNWPSADLPILRGYANIGDSLKIAFNGLDGTFSLGGTVGFRGGEVFYFLRSFYIRQGYIKFNENEVRFDPELSVAAEIRDQNEEGPVTVSMIVDQAPLSAFTPRFESTPALSQAEIFSMLGQNLVGSDSATGSSQSQAALLSASSDFLTQFNVIRVFERNARDALGLDMFSVRTQFIQNALFSATGIIDEPVDRNGGLGNYFDNTTVYMGKFLGSDIYLQALLSVQINDADVSDTLGVVELEPNFGIEWKTPLFLLNWNFSPDLNNPERLFIDDHSFTFTWRKSF